MSIISLLDRISATAVHARDPKESFHVPEEPYAVCHELTVIRELLEKLAGESLPTDESEIVRDRIRFIFDWIRPEDVPPLFFHIIQQYAEWIRDAAYMQSRGPEEVCLQTLAPLRSLCIEDNVDIETDPSSMQHLEKCCYGSSGLPLGWFKKGKYFGFRMMQAMANVKNGPPVGYVSWKPTKTADGSAVRIAWARMGMDLRLDEHERTMAMEGFCEDIKRILHFPASTEFRIIIPANHTLLAESLIKARFEQERNVSRCFAMGQEGKDERPGPYQNGLVFVRKDDSEQKKG